LLTASTKKKVSLIVAAISGGKGEKESPPHVRSIPSHKAKKRKSSFSSRGGQSLAKRGGEKEKKLTRRRKSERGVLARQHFLPRYEKKKGTGDGMTAERKGKKRSEYHLERSGKKKNKCRATLPRGCIFPLCGGKRRGEYKRTGRSEGRGKGQKEGYRQSRERRKSNSTRKGALLLQKKKKSGAIAGRHERGRRRKKSLSLKAKRKTGRTDG